MMEIVGDYMVFHDLVIDCKSIVTINKCNNDNADGTHAQIALGKGGQTNTWNAKSCSFEDVKQEFLKCARKGVKQ